MEWHDDPFPKYFSDLIGDLRDEVWKLKGQISVAETEDQIPNVPVSGHEAALQNVVLSLQVQLNEKNAELEAMNGKYMNVVMVFIVFVVGVVVGKMLVY